MHFAKRWHRYPNPILTDGMHCAQCSSVRISPDAHRNIEWKGFTSFCWVLVLGSRVHVLLLGLVLVLGSRVLVMGLRFRF